MDDTRLDKVHLPKFGVDVFRLPGFVFMGNRVKPRFHSSLVDAWFMSGYSNDDKPTSITGVKGNELQLKNFAYSLSSGFGKYTTGDFNNLQLHPYNGTNVIKTPYKIKITGLLESVYICYSHTHLMSLGSVKIRVTGFPSNTNKIILYKYTDENLNLRFIEINNNGVYILPKHNKDENNNYVTGFTSNYPLDEEKFIGLTIELLPENYEGALVFDGVDDYAYLDKFDTLIGEDGIFTVIGKYDNFRTNQDQSFNLYARSNIIGSQSQWIRSQWIRINQPTTVNDSILNGVRSYTVDFKNMLYKNVVTFGKEFIDCSFPYSYDVMIPKYFSLNGFIQGNKPYELSTTAHYYVAIYKGELTPEEVEEEKVKLEKEWNKRLKL